MSVMPFEPEGFFDILDWKPFVPMESWMEAEVVVLDGGNKGSFSTYRMPHMKRIFQEVDKIRVIKITLMFASQAGKTITLVNVVLKRLDTDPDNSIIMFPKGNQVKKLYDNKIKPYIDGCETIVQKMDDFVEDKKAHQSSYSKKVAGAILSILDSNNTKSVSAKTIGFDEVADFPPSKVGEAIERLKSFDGKGELALLASTRDPYKEGKDEISHHYNISEIKLQYWANCRECGHQYYPEPETLVYPTVEEWKTKVGIEGEVPKIILLSEYAPYVRESARLKCPHCEQVIDNEQRREQILNEEFEWIEVVPKLYNEDGSVKEWQKTDTPKQNYTSVGFDVNTLCIEGFHMGKIAEKIVQDNYGENVNDDLQHTWVGYFNRPYIPIIKKADVADMLLLGNGLKEWTVPKDTLKIYMGVDTQKDHFWYEIRAYCYNDISHTIAYGRLETFADIEDTWLLAQTIKGEDGDDWMCAKMGIDRRGYNEEEFNRTHEVDYFVQYMVKKYKNGDENRIYATMGVPEITGNKAIQVINDKDLSANRNPLDIKILKISNRYVKNSLNAAIERNIEKQKGEEETFESKLFYVNQDIIQSDAGKTTSVSYIRQYTAEVYDFGKSKTTGKMDTKKSWINPKQADNHLWDCGVTCEAFALQDKLSMQKKTNTQGLGKSVASLFG